jgi:hypothetical protein
MAAFNDALDLRTAVYDTVGSRSISDVWQRLVRMAEDQLNQRLRTNWQVTNVTLVFTDGVADLPADFLEMMHVYGPCGYQMRSGMTTDQHRHVPSTTTYSIVGNKIYIRGFSGNKDVTYYAKLPTISNSLSSTNWLLERFGSAYLYAVSLQAAKFLRDVELSQTVDQLMSTALNEVKVEDDRARWSNGVVRVQGLTP